MRIALIGAGNMGEAILAGIHKKHECLVCEPRLDRQKYLRKKYRVTVGPLAEVVQAAQAVVLAVKPQDFPELLAELASQQIKDKLFISIAAGITTRFIEKALARSAALAAKPRVVRVMPNLPALVGQGMSGIASGRFATPRDGRLAEDVFQSVGSTVVVKEAMLDALTAVSGSGPAYVFLFVECWLASARKLGFSEAEARQLVYRTLSGSVSLLEQSPEPASVLRERVTSKGGTTQAAMDVFFGKDMQSIFEEALQAACRRARELSK
ncbi:MAG: pyrroline-5-carboxylate reductase [Candidatus Omnitrophica bacterium]|nr:pyrroline-5-carboxylate reductase [Candidatus Omnitrophota bacterium]